MTAPNIIKSANVVPERRFRVISFTSAEQKERISPEEAQLQQVQSSLEKKMLQLKNLQKQITELQAKSEQILNKSKLDSELIIRKAREEAENIISAAKLKADEVRQQAWEEGFSAGKEKGKAVALEEFAAAVGRAKKLFDDIVGERNTILKSAEKEVLELSKHIARIILKNQIRLDDGIVLNNIREALKKVVAKKNVKLLISSEDFSTINEHKDELISLIKGVENFEIVENAYLTRGGCIVETDIGNVDASLEAQFSELEKALAQQSEEISDHDDTK